MKPPRLRGESDSESDQTTDPDEGASDEAEAVVMEDGEAVRGPEELPKRKHGNVPL